MSYTPPPEYEHGNITVAGYLQAFSNSLNYIKGLLGAKAINPAVPYRMNSTRLYNWNTDDPDAVIWVDHQRRYLHYLGEGKLYNESGSQNASLSKSDLPTVFDLDSVAWLNYGQTYKITGVTWAFEDWD